MQKDEDKLPKMKRYLSVDMLLMRTNNLSLEKWVLLENIDFLSKNEYHACFASKKTMAYYLGVSDRKIFRLVNELVEEGFVVKNNLFHLKVTQKWVEISSILAYAKMSYPMTKRQSDYDKMADDPMTKCHTKIDIYKRDNKKDIETPLIIPENTIDFELLQQFIRHREEMKKPFTQSGLNHFIQKLEKLKNEGQDISGLIYSSIISGYPDVYPDKKSNAHSRHSKRARGEQLQNGLNAQGLSDAFDLYEEIEPE